MNEITIPNPGSDEAIDKGCTCPIVANYFGKGSPYKVPKFILDKKCPLHYEDGIQKETIQTYKES